eukprot:TRINITY_DN606_c2_g1_i2.p1 TRINITY_DN606_c2_g1~~TRINITY_DN606_c2_g1_i2.p1  ORF type:complete len:934 (+),score=161.77 TRINITY_DN606_c2_g1_i2:439-3240(+)
MDMDKNRITHAKLGHSPVDKHILTQLHVLLFLCTVVVFVVCWYFDGALSLVGQLAIVELFLYAIGGFVSLYHPTMSRALLYGQMNLVFILCGTKGSLNIVSGIETFQDLRMTSELIWLILVPFLMIHFEHAVVSFFGFVVVWVEMTSLYYYCSAYVCCLVCCVCKVYVNVDLTSFFHYIVCRLHPEQSSEYFRLLLSTLFLLNALGACSLAFAASRMSTMRKLSAANKELKSVLHELEETNQRLQRATEAKSRFLANMSHELRTPMHGIIVMSEQLLISHKNILAENDALEPVQIIAECADHLLALLTDVLDFSRLECGRMKMEAIPFSVPLHADKVGQVLSTMAEKKHVSIVVNNYMKKAMRLGDPLRFKQLLFNLIGNSIKFTGEKGSITVSLYDDISEGRALVDSFVGWEARQTHKQDEDESISPLSDKTTRRKGSNKPTLGQAAEISEEPELSTTETVYVAVQDTGVGMSADSADSLFRSYSQADSSIGRKFGGSGLGLSICKKICSAMGGRIGVKSQENEGSIFWFTLRIPLSSEMDATSSSDRDVELTRGLLPKLLLHSLEGPEDSALSVGRRLSLPKDQTPSDDIRDTIIESSTDNSNNNNDNNNTTATTTTTSATPNEANATLSHNVQSLEQQQSHPPPLTDGNEGNGSLVGCDVLLVEDNRVNQRITRKLLESLGCLVTIAENGEQAVEAVKRWSFDGVLMDCNMPVMNGFIATTTIRNYERENSLQNTTNNSESTPNIATDKAKPACRVPIVALTASDTTEYYKQCLECGMDGCLTKPLRRVEFIKVFTECVGDWRANHQPAPQQATLAPTPPPSTAATTATTTATSPDTSRDNSSANNHDTTPATSRTPANPPQQIHTTTPQPKQQQPHQQQYIDEIRLQPSLLVVVATAGSRQHMHADHAIAHAAHSAPPPPICAMPLHIP